MKERDAQNVCVYWFTCVCVCVCVCKRERDLECLSSLKCVWVCVDREFDKMCVCVCERERERETERKTERKRERECKTMPILKEVESILQEANQRKNTIFLQQPPV